MPIDPFLETQRLSAAYREKCDAELFELAEDFAALTPAAQQALRGEMLSRNLGDPTDPASMRIPQAPFRAPLAPRSAPWAAGSMAGHALGALGAQHYALEPDSSGSAGDEANAHDYTWKTPLCDCASREQALQLQEALRRAGLECWFNFDGVTASTVPAAASRWGIGAIRVLVAADQLEPAQAVAAQPIPQQIIDEFSMEIPEFVEPNCPQCGSEDVVLEAVDPENTWRCEQCDMEWTDSQPEAGA